MRIEFKKYYYTFVFDDLINLETKSSLASGYVLNGGAYVPQSKLKHDEIFKEKGFYLLQGDKLDNFNIAISSEGDSIYSANKLYYDFKGELKKLPSQNEQLTSLGIDSSGDIVFEDKLIIKPFSEITIGKKLIKLTDTFSYFYLLNHNSYKTFIFEY